MFEELLKDEEVQEQQIYPKIYVGKRSELLIEEIDDLLENFMTMEKAELRERLLVIAHSKMDSKQKLSIST